ncbi:MAG: SPOR domain-containing protein [Moraxellaceae bacterium]|nr:SPOR domain-containing protein [Moraxellaceae bacterium]
MMTVRWPLLLFWAGSGLLLVLAVLVLVMTGKGGTLPGKLVLEKPTATQARFEDGFGSLDALVPFAGGIAPSPVLVTPEVVGPVEHAPEFREVDWLRSRNPHSYTLQVMAARDEASVLSYLAAREDRASLNYFINLQSGEAWYVVVRGDYPSRELALAALEADTAPGESRPFPRNFGVYQKALPPTQPASAAF